MQEEKRECPRVPLKTIALVKKIDENVTRAVRVRDLGTNGIGIYSNRVFQKNEQLLVELALPSEQNEAEMVTLPGEVVWVEPIQGAARYIVGIKFHLLVELEEKLRLYIDSIEQILSNQEIESSNDEN